MEWGGVKCVTSFVLINLSSKTKTNTESGEACAALTIPKRLHASYGLQTRRRTNPGNLSSLAGTTDGSWRARCAEYEVGKGSESNPRTADLHWPSPSPTYVRPRGCWSRVDRRRYMDVRPLNCVRPYTAEPERGGTTDSRRQGPCIS